MALNGSVSTNTIKGRYYTLSWTATQSITNNTSTISWTLSADGDEGWVAERTLNVVVAGDTIISKTDRVERVKGVVKTGTTTVSHDANGNASFGISIQAAIYYSNVNGTAYKTETLNTIARMSTLTNNATLNLGQETTLTIDRQGDNKHTVIVSCSGGTSVTACTLSTATSVTFTPPEEWATQYPNSLEGDCTIAIHTYTPDGGTLIGTKTYSRVFYISGDAFMPSGSFTVSDNEGYYDTYSLYLAELSKPKIVVSPTLKFGASVAQYTVIIKLNGGSKTYTSTSAAIVADSLMYGAATIEVYIEDSRGNYAKVGTTTVTIVQYSAPSITMIRADRCDADGTLNEEGVYAKVTFTATITSLNDLNTWTGSRWFKRAGETTTYSNSFEGGSLTNRETAAFELAADKSCTASIRITDGLGNVTSREIQIATVFTLMHFNAAGNGMAIGKISEVERTLEIGLPIIMYNFESIMWRVGDKNWYLIDFLSGGTFRLGYSQYNAKLPTEIYGGSIYLYAASGSRIYNVGDTQFSADVYMPYDSTIYGSSISVESESGFELRGVDDSIIYTDGDLTVQGDNSLYLTSSGDIIISGPVTASSYISASGIVRNKRVQLASGGAYVGFFDSTGSTRWAYIGPDNSTNFYVTNSQSGSNITNKSWTTSSDARLKTDINDIPDEFVDLWLELQPKMFKYIDTYGDDGRYHFGMVAQDVIEIFDKYDLDPNDYGFVSTMTLASSFDPVESDDVVGEDVPETEPLEYYALNYEYFDVLTLLVSQKQQVKILGLEERVSKLEQLVTKLTVQ